MATKHQRKEGRRSAKAEELDRWAAETYGAGMPGFGRDYGPRRKPRQTRVYTSRDDRKVFGGLFGPKGKLPNPGQGKKGSKTKQLKNFTGTVTRLANGQVIVLGVQR
jgi:hypothetical protein